MSSNREFSLGRFYLRAAFLLLFITFFSFPAMGADLIPKENRVVLKKAVYEPYGAEWVPDEKNIKKALKGIHQYLMDAGKDASLNEFSKEEIKKILADFSKYKVQFIGAVKDGKKIIHCNFFQGSVPYWKESYVMVMDGGYIFWQIDYETETGRCFNFSSNGYA